MRVFSLIPHQFIAPRVLDLFLVAQRKRKTVPQDILGIALCTCLSSCPSLVIVVSYIPFRLADSAAGATVICLPYESGSNQ
jgi:hypothetical protein